MGLRGSRLRWARPTEPQALASRAPRRHGCLQAWAGRGVFLLNAALSVRAGAAGSHKELGWETITDAAVAALSARRRGLVFLLWGQAHACTRMHTHAHVCTRRHTYAHAGPRRHT